MAHSSTPKLTVVERLERLQRVYAIPEEQRIPHGRHMEEYYEKEVCPFDGSVQMVKKRRNCVMQGLPDEPELFVCSLDPMRVHLCDKTCSYGINTIDFECVCELTGKVKDLGSFYDEKTPEWKMKKKRKPSTKTPDALARSDVLDVLQRVVDYCKVHKDSIIEASVAGTKNSKEPPLTEAEFDDKFRVFSDFENMTAFAACISCLLMRVSKCLEKGASYTIRRTILWTAVCLSFFRSGVAAEGIFPKLEILRILPRSTDLHQHISTEYYNYNNSESVAKRRHTFKPATITKEQNRWQKNFRQLQELEPEETKQLAELTRRYLPTPYL